MTFTQTIEISNQVTTIQGRDQQITFLAKSAENQLLNSEVHHSPETGRSKNCPVKQKSSTKRENLVYSSNKNENSFLNTQFRNVYVINSSNNSGEYIKWQQLINLHLTAFTAGSLPAEVEKQMAIADISDSVVDEATMTLIKTAFIVTPPSFVNDKKSIHTDTYGITSAEYVKFIVDVFNALNHKDITEAKKDSDEGKDEKKKALIKKISEVIGEIMEKWDTSFKSNYEDEVEYNQIDKKGKKSNVKKNFKQAWRHQLAIFWATLFGCIKSEKAYTDHCTPIKWNFERIFPKNKTTTEIKIEAGLPSKMELAQLLTLKKTKSGNDETRIVLAEKIAKIQGEEASKITDADKKNSYMKIVIPGIKDYVTKFFTHKLVRDNTSGVSSMISLLKDAKSDSLFLDFLEKIYNEAAQALECKKLSDTVIEIESDGEDVVIPICSHKVKLLEPPSFSEYCKSIHKFSPPIYRAETYGDFIDFIEGPALRYIRKFPQMSFMDRGIAIWWVLKSDRLKNTFMKHFGKYLTEFALSNEKEFQNLYVQVSRKLFPEQDKTPVDYQHQLSDLDWLTQTDDEDFDELLDRIKDCLENAYPNEHMSDVNRIRLADSFYAALKDKFYQKYIDEYHYDDYFKKGKINHVVTQLNKKKQVRLEQSRRKQHFHSQNVNSVSRNSKHQSKNFSQSRDFRLGNSENVRLKQDGKPSKNVSYVNQNNYQRNQKHDSTEHRQPEGRYPNRNHGTSYQKNGARHSHSGSAEISELKKEIIFLTRNKNINPKGGHWIELDQIDPKVTNSPGFDIRNFVPEKQYKNTVAQALTNIGARTERMKNSRDQAVRTRRNRRKSQSSFRRKNVVVNRREVNQVSSNVFRISSETTMHILKLSRDDNEVSNGSTTEIDSYKIMVGCGDRHKQTTVRAIIDSGAGVNLIGSGVYQKLKVYGTFKEIDDLASVPKLRGASSDKLNVTGELSLDINIGKRTTYKNCRILVSDSVPSNFFVLGTEFLTDLKQQLSFLLTPVFHRCDCENTVLNQIIDSCTDDCAITTNSMVLNPMSSLDCDIVNFIPNSSSYVRFLENIGDLVDDGSEENTSATLRFGTYEAPKNQALKMRFVTDTKINVAPNSMQAVAVKPQEESWNQSTNEFVWADMTKDDQNVLVLAEPTRFLEKSGLMNAETEEAIYSVADNVFMIKNHTDESFQIGVGTAVANIYLMA